MSERRLPLTAFLCAISLSLPVRAELQDHQCDDCSSPVHEIVHEVVVRSAENEEPQVFFLQEGERVQPGVIKLRAKQLSGAFLGVHLIDLTPELRQHFGIAGERGLLVSRVEAESPAARGGVSVGDVLLTADGQDLSSRADLRREIRERGAGASLLLGVQRGDERLELTAALEPLAAHLDPSVHFEVETDEGEGQGKVFRFAWQCDEAECPEIEEIQLLDASMLRLQELLESGQLVEPLPEEDPALRKRLELLERRLQAIEQEIDERSPASDEPDER